MNTVPHTASSVARRAALWLALIALTLAAGCSTSGFSRALKVPPPPMEVTPSGVKYQELSPGNGPPAVPGTLVTVNYTGFLEDKTRFDSSEDRGVPLTFTIGKHEVVTGWEEGMIGMRAGGKRRLVIPPELAYGEKGRAGVIPPNATITLEVELVEVFGP
jgi:FKBP-type peptidyl-prolyl cis-trans isomerase